VQGAPYGHPEQEGHVMPAEIEPLMSRIHFDTVHRKRIAECRKIRLGARMTNVEKFLEACDTSRDVSRRLSCRGIGRIRRELPDALRAVVQLGAVHPAAQMEFLDTWTRVPVWEDFRAKAGDDDLWFAALRLLLPPHRDNGPMTLYRGQCRDYPPGMSWTRSPHIAEGFARYGTAVRARQRRARTDGVVLEAECDSEIICAPCLLGHREGEYIIDPRGVTKFAVLDLP